MRKALITLTLGLALMLTVVSCASGTGTGSSGGATLNTTMTEMKYDPATWTAKAGEQVTVSAKNSGTVIHDWIVKGQEGATKLEVEAGKSGTKTFSLPAGTYEVYCSQPGHEAAGMKGTLTVQ